MTTAHLIQIALLLLITGMLMRALRNSAAAVRVARDTKSEVSNTASNARATLNRLEALGDKTSHATDRMEDAADLVADNLADAKGRADDALGTPGPGPGAAADAAAVNRPPAPE